MTPAEQLRALASTERVSIPESNALIAVLLRDWAMRVLDAWRAIDRPTRWWSMGEAHDYDGKLSDYCCTLEWVGGSKDYAGASDDAARLAAADALWPELPADVRAKIGERP